MAKRINLSRGTKINSDGTVTPIFGELKLDDVEEWTKEDYKKAYALLAQKYHDADYNDNAIRREMILYLRDKIGQDFEAIEAAITQFFKEQT